MMVKNEATNDNPTSHDKLRRACFRRGPCLLAWLLQSLLWLAMLMLVAGHASLWQLLEHIRFRGSLYLRTFTFNLLYYWAWNCTRKKNRI